MQITVDDALAIPLGRGGKYGTLNVDMSRMPANVLDYYVKYGVRQSLNDAIADKTDDDGAPLSTEALVAKAQKRLDTHYAGDLRQRGTGDGAEPVDPVEAEIHRSVLAIMRNAYANEKAPKEHKGHKRLLWIANQRRVARGQPEVGSLHDVVDAYMQGAPNAAQIRREAERTVKARAADGTADFL
jgi:hypothetical protein